MRMVTSADHLVSLAAVILGLMVPAHMLAIPIVFSVICASAAWARSAHQMADKVSFLLAWMAKSLVHHQLHPKHFASLTRVHPSPTPKHFSQMLVTFLTKIHRLHFRPFLLELRRIPHLARMMYRGLPL